MNLETNLERVKRLAAEREKENWRFRAFLKFTDLSTDQLDDIVHRHFKEVSKQIDCCACANCCKEMLPCLTNADIRRLAMRFQIAPSEVKHRYLRRGDEEGEWIFKAQPCPFLSNNKCTVYEDRPDACRSYPHLHKNEFVFRLISVVQNCSLCPIVFNVYERLKEELWRDRNRVDDDYSAEIEGEDDELGLDEDFEEDDESGWDMGQARTEKTVYEALEWAEQFAKSAPYARLTEEQKDHAALAIKSFARFASQELGEQPADWTRGTVRACCLRILPRSVAAKDSFFQCLAPILEAFFTWLSQSGRLRGAQRLAREVGTLGEPIVRAARDVENWGMSKTMMMSAIQAGVDPNDDEAFASYLEEHYARLLERQRLLDNLPDFDSTQSSGTVPAPVAQPTLEPPIDRYAPCPCGSGKKYKFCCGKKD